MYIPNEFWYGKYDIIYVPTKWQTHFLQVTVQLLPYTEQRYVLYGSKFKYTAKIFIQV